MALHGKTSRRLDLEGQEDGEPVPVESGADKTKYWQLKLLIYMIKTKWKSQGLSKFPISRICPDLY